MNTTHTLVLVLAAASHVIAQSATPPNPRYERFDKNGDGKVSREEGGSLGARVEVAAAGRKPYRWIHPNHSYKSSGALEARFGLGRQTSADLKVTLPSGKTLSLAGVKADQFLDWKLTFPSELLAGRGFIAWAACRTSEAA